MEVDFHGKREYVSELRGPSNNGYHTHGHLVRYCNHSFLRLDLLPLVCGNHIAHSLEEAEAHPLAGLLRQRTRFWRQEPDKAGCIEALTTPNLGKHSFLTSMELKIKVPSCAADIGEGSFFALPYMDFDTGSAHALDCQGLLDPTQVMLQGCRQDGGVLRWGPEGLGRYWVGPRLNFGFRRRGCFQSADLASGGVRHLEAIVNGRWQCH